MGYRLEFSVDALPKSLNKALRTNRYKSNRVNKNWDLLVNHLIRNQLPPEPLKRARIRITRNSYRTLDFDGLVGSMKPVVDALVSSGVLKDDSWNVVGAWDIYQVFRPKALGPLLEITVIEI